MAFGFDPGIILSARPAEQPRGPSLAELLQLRRANDQQDTLASIYRGGASNPAGLGRALFGAGFGAQAQQWQGNQAELEQRAAAAQKAMQDSIRERMEALGRAFHGVKDQAGVDAARDLLKQNGWDDQHLAVIPERYDATTAPIFERIAGMGAPLAKQLSPEEEAARAARAEYETAKAEALRRGVGVSGGRNDPDKAENLRLRNEKLRKELGGAGPNKLLTLDGYDLDPNFDVKPEVTEKLREAQGQVQGMIGDVDELMALYRKHGNKVLPSADRARAEALTRHLQLRAKSKAGFDLGVIAGPDMALLESVIPNPTNKQATLADFFSGGGDASETMERYRVFREQMAKNFDAAATSRGYRRRAAKKATPAGKVRMRAPDGQTGTVDASEVADAEANGWTRI